MQMKRNCWGDITVLCNHMTQICGELWCLDSLGEILRGTWNIQLARVAQTYFNTGALWHVPFCFFEYYLNTRSFSKFSIFQLGKCYVKVKWWVSIFSGLASHFMVAPLVFTIEKCKADIEVHGNKVYLKLQYLCKKKKKSYNRQQVLFVFCIKIKLSLFLHLFICERKPEISVFVFLFFCNLTLGHMSVGENICHFKHCTFC